MPKSHNHSDEDFEDKNRHAREENEQRKNEDDPEEEEYLRELRRYNARWRARLLVDALLLLLAFFGMVIIDYRIQDSWMYWRIMVPIFAILCIWLSWFVKDSLDISYGRIGKEIVQWIALLVMM